MLCSFLLHSTNFLHPRPLSPSRGFPHHTKKEILCKTFLTTKTWHLYSEERYFETRLIKSFFILIISFSAPCSNIKYTIHLPVLLKIIKNGSLGIHTMNWKACCGFCKVACDCAQCANPVGKPPTLSRKVCHADTVAFDVVKGNLRWRNSKVAFRNRCFLYQEKAF